MKKLHLPISILLLAALACTWGGPSRGVPRLVKTAPPAVQATESQAAPEGSTADPSTVHIPNLSAGEATAAAAPETAAPEATEAPQEGGGPLDPHVEISASAASLKVGETITITGMVVDVELPLFSLVLRDEGVQDALPAAQVSAEGVATPLEGSSRVLEFVSASGDAGHAVFVLRAKAAGTTTVSIVAAGEAASGSGDVLISVEK